MVRPSLDLLHPGGAHCPGPGHSPQRWSLFSSGISGGRLIGQRGCQAPRHTKAASTSSLAPALLNSSPSPWIFIPQGGQGVSNLSSASALGRNPAAPQPLLPVSLLWQLIRIQLAGATDRGPGTPKSPLSFLGDSRGELETGSRGGRRSRNQGCSDGLLGHKLLPGYQLRLAVSSSPTLCSCNVHTPVFRATSASPANSLEELTLGKASRGSTMVSPACPFHSIPIGPKSLPSGVGSLGTALLPSLLPLQSP